MYDNNGDYFGFNYNGTEYFYIKNAQNDVVAITDANGAVVAKYKYDAWGSSRGISDNIIHTPSGSSIGQINPIRYRSYYYENDELEVFYLNSRYYVPLFNRFLNADAVVAGVGGGVSGYNMFAYCMNNPVNMSDESGQWPKWIENAVNSMKTWAANTFGTQTKVTTSKDVGFPVETNYWLFKIKTGVVAKTDNSIGKQKPITGYTDISNKSAGVSTKGKQFAADASVSLTSFNMSAGIKYNNIDYSLSSEQTYSTVSFSYMSSVSSGNISTGSYTSIEINKCHVAVAAVACVYASSGN